MAASFVTLAVAICPSVSTLSMVPVGKYGMMKWKERAKYLKLCTLQVSSIWNYVYEKCLFS